MEEIQLLEFSVGVVGMVEIPELQQLPQVVLVERVNFLAEMAELAAGHRHLQMPQAQLLYRVVVVVVE